MDSVRWKILWKFCLFIITLLSGQGYVGCYRYSFTGASISPNVKTISIELFQNTAALVQPTLAPQFTEALRNRFITQTNLKMTVGQADLQFSGQITDYSITPLTIQRDRAAQNRLTISVWVKFINVVEPEKSWEQVFTNFADFSASRSLSEVEAALNAEIIEKITQDIFNKALANW
ncbi:MAG: LptE family protein [Bacteroidia bacterium]|nr:LPS assembly lipoprotein LptE [Bacteroidia bacterium]MDW8158260.1 LptE family protein [Bacteroidia bacterium]